MEPASETLKPGFVWTAEHDKKLHALQVAELFRQAGVAAVFSFFGAVITLGVFHDTGETTVGLFWFAYATAVTIFRLLVLVSYDRDPDRDKDAGHYARMAIIGNALAGVQWGLLGTALFPTTSGYRELYSIMVITCYVGGSVTAYSSVRWAHPALALPATIPPAIYLFFVRDGLHVFGGIAALFFCCAVIYYGVKLHRQIEERLRLMIENNGWLELAGRANEALARENRELAHRAAMKTKTAFNERSRATLMASHIDRTPLPVLECGSDHVLLSWNEAAEKLFARSTEDAPGRSLVELLFPTATREQFAQALNEVATDRIPRSLEAELQDRDGNPVEGILHVTPILGPDHLPLRIAIIISGLRANEHLRLSQSDEPPAGQ